MNIFSYTILILFILNIFALLVASVIWKNKNVNFATFILAGSFIYRDLSKYIRPDRGKAYLIISCSSIFIFMLLILSAVIFEKPLITNRWRNRRAKARAPQLNRSYHKLIRNPSETAIPAT